MSEQSSKEQMPGQKQPPRLHGDGCICGDFARHGCPARGSHENQTRDADARVIAASRRLNAANAELDAAEREHREANEALEALEALSKP